MENMVTVEALLEMPDASATTKRLKIEGVGMVRIRALSLADYEEARREARLGDEFDVERWQTFLLVKGLDEPRVVYDQAAKLRRKRAGAMQEIIGHILLLSGLSSVGGVSVKAVDDAEASFQEGPAQVQGA